MKIRDILLREKTQPIVSIGDSHAVAIARAGQFRNLATNGRSAFHTDNDQAIRSVSPGSRVVLSAGANDQLRSNKVQTALRVRDLLEQLLDLDCTVYYVLFAQTDHPKFSSDRNRLRSLISRAIPPQVRVLDMGSLSVRQGDGIHAPQSWYQQAASQIRR